MLDSGREYFFKYTVYRMKLFFRLATKALDTHIDQNIQRNIHNIINTLIVCSLPVMELKLCLPV